MVIHPLRINAPGTRHLVFQRHNGQLSKCETAAYLTAHTGIVLVLEYIASEPKLGRLARVKRGYREAHTDSHIYVPLFTTVRMAI